MGGEGGGGLSAFAVSFSGWFFFDDDVLFFSSVNLSFLSLSLSLFLSFGPSIHLVFSFFFFFFILDFFFTGLVFRLDSPVTTRHCPNSTEMNTQKNLQNESTKKKTTTKGFDFNDSLYY